MNLWSVGPACQIEPHELPHGPSLFYSFPCQRRNAPSLYFNFSSYFSLSLPIRTHTTLSPVASDLCCRRQLRDFIALYDPRRYDCSMSCSLAHYISLSLSLSLSRVIYNSLSLSLNFLSFELSQSLLSFSLHKIRCGIIFLYHVTCSHLHVNLETGLEARWRRHRPIVTFLRIGRILQ